QFRCRRHPPGPALPRRRRARDRRGGASAATGRPVARRRFRPHDLEFLRDEHAHRRLGFAPETVTQWMKAAGLGVLLQHSLPPEPASEGQIAVSLWLGRDPRLAVTAPALEVA